MTVCSYYFWTCSVLFITTKRTTLWGFLCTTFDVGWESGRPRCKLNRAKWNWRYRGGCWIWQNLSFSPAIICCSAVSKQSKLVSFSKPLWRSNLLRSNITAYRSFRRSFCNGRYYPACLLCRVQFFQLVVDINRQVSAQKPRILSMLIDFEL